MRDEQALVDHVISDVGAVKPRDAQVHAAEQDDTRPFRSSLVLGGRGARLPAELRSEGWVGSARAPFEAV